MLKLSIYLAFAYSCAIFVNPLWAMPASEFDSYMQVWNEKSELASKYLKQAEKQLKLGDKLQGCKTQTLAADYGIQATESLLKAFEISGSTTDLSGLKSGLNKWRQLRDFC